MATASQSVELPTLLASIQMALERVIAPIASPYLVRFWVGNDRPRYEGSAVLTTYRLTTQTPVRYIGANRRGFLSNQTLEVFVYSRYAVDVAGTDWQLATNQGNGFYRTMLRVVDCFQGLNIFSAYDGNWQPNDTDGGTAGIPEDARPLTIRPCQMNEFLVPYKPKDDPGWIAGKVSFDLLLVQPLTI
jgi:hypothetical protein